MNSLSARLLAAFSLVIVAVLLFVGLALVVVLRDDPIVERQTAAALNEKARLIQRQNPPVKEAVQDGAAYVTLLAGTYDVRVVIATPAGQTLADSEAPGAELNLLKFRNARPNGAVPGSVIGRARDAKLQTWLYVAHPAGPERVLLLAAPLPRFAALIFFIENLLGPLLQAGAIAAALAVLLAVLIARSIARPLQTMAEVAHGVALGNYAAAAPATGPDEVRDLGQSINRMAQQVQASQQAQRDFLANVSHELKTPLTSIQGFAQAIADGTVDSTQGVQRSAGIIHAEAQRMRRMVEELLDLARLEAGLKSLKREPVELRALLAAAADKFSLRAQEKQVTLRADLPPVLPMLKGDGDRLAQVFTNLLDNALQHTPAGGAITLSAAPTAAGLAITVADTGAGIPPDDVPRIFERFYQVDKARTRTAGLGLGLTISKDIVEAHGGRLSVASQLGRGSQFTVLLPPARADDTTIGRKKKD